MRVYKIFTPDEKEFIFSNYKTMNSQSIADRLGVNKLVVSNFKKRNLLFVKINNFFTEQEVSFINENCKSMTRKSIANHLNRGMGSINHFFTNNKISSRNQLRKLIKIKNHIDLHDQKESASEELATLINFTYQGIMFDSAYSRVKFLSKIINS